MGARDSLVGRAEEVAALTGFLQDGADDALVLTGEAGTGKTALWTTGIDEAVTRGMHVLVATPGEGEERYSYAVVADLLSGVDLDELSLSPPLREALEVVLLRVGATEPLDGQVVAVALHAALAAFARERTVLVCVDDVQWADPASVEALTFAARRLAGHGVRFLLARRAGYARSLLEALLVRRRLRYLEPRPLDVPELSRALVQELGLIVPPRVARLVHEQSRGNPLHALEIGRVLLERGVPGLGEPLGVPEELAAVLGVRVRDLPDEQRTTLLAIALEPQLVEPVLSALVGVDAVERAVRDRLVVVTPAGRVRPAHPLLAATTRESTSPGRVRELHLRLAGLMPTDGPRARHRALANPDPDEELATSLSAAADEAVARGAMLEAAELAELALERTPPDSEHRPARVVALAERLAPAGESARLSSRIEPEIASLPHGPARGTACLLMLDGIVGSIDHLEHWIDRALEECGGDAEIRATALQIKATVALGIRVSGVPAALALAEEAAALGTEQGVGRDWFLVHTGHPPETDDAHAWSKHHLWRGEVPPAEDAVRSELAAAEEQGRMRDVVENQIGLSEIAVRTGRLDEARDLLTRLDDALMTDKETRDEDLLRAAVAVLAGDAATGAHWARLTQEWAHEFGHGWIELESLRLRGVAALLAGDPEEAVTHLQAAWDRVAAAGVGDPGIFPVSPDLVEALVQVERYDDARAVLAWLEERAVAQEHPWGLASVDRGRALVELASGTISSPEAADLMRRAADRFAGLGLRPDEARTCLAVGGVQRRLRQWGLAREALDRARTVFADLGAEGWEQLATGELAKVGGRQPRASAELTPAERATAELAAQGLANKEIARRTGVAIGTVEAHLSRCYLKLGVRSRSQLAGALATSSSD